MTDIEEDFVFGLAGGLVIAFIQCASISVKTAIPSLRSEADSFAGTRSDRLEVDSRSAGTLRPGCHREFGVVRTEHTLDDGGYLNSTIAAPY